jgi:hypothetical protein
LTTVVSSHTFYSDSLIIEVGEREITVVKSVLNHHLYEAVTIEGVGKGDYCGQVCFKSPPL